MTANHEYAPTTFRGPDPTYVVSLKYAAGSRQVKMSPQEIEKAIESIITAAEQRGAARALREAAIEISVRDGSTARGIIKSNRDSIVRWLRSRADRIANKEGDE